MTAPKTSTAHLESNVEAFFRKRVRTLGGYTFKIVPTEAGLPDRCVLMPGGRVYFVELKSVDGALRPAQVEWHRKAARLGTHVVVLSGKAEVVLWLRDITDAFHREQVLAERRARRAGLTEVL